MEKLTDNDKFDSYKELKRIISNQQVLIYLVFKITGSCNVNNIIWRVQTCRRNI